MWYCLTDPGMGRRPLAGVFHMFYRGGVVSFETVEDYVFWCRLMAAGRIAD